MIPTESRDEIDALKYGRSRAEFLDHIWAQRALKQPQAQLRWPWPITIYDRTNVTTLKRKKP